MLKSITLWICLLFITTVGRSQEFNLLNTSPGENTELKENNWEPLEVQDEINWRENSVGIFFMPKPIGINAIEIDANYNGNYTGNDDLRVLQIAEDFSVGLGASLNFDFRKSGDGLGNITYIAYILGDKDGTSAFDIFTALKFDFKLGSLSRFELSPFVGMGNLSLKRVDDIFGESSGSSLYLSGGVRITYLVINNLFVGADIQTVPYVLDVKNLFDLSDAKTIPNGDGGTVEIDIIDAEIQYAVPYFQVNLSIRYNIF